MRSINPIKNNPDTFSGRQSNPSQKGADLRVEQILKDDRALLSGRHNAERSRARVMGVLAASAMPAGGGGVLSWISQMIGGKGITGTLAVVAATGGVTVSAVLLTNALREKTPPAKSESQIRSALPSQLEPPVLSAPESPVPEILEDAPVRDVESGIVKREGEPARNKAEEKSGASTAPADLLPPPNSQEEKTAAPQEYHTSNARAHMIINPLEVKKK